MHASRTLVAAALAVAALGLLAPLAAADPGREGPSDIVVTPVTVKQGGTLTITVDGRSCRGTGRAYDPIVESNAFPRTRLRGQPGTSSSVARPKVFGAVEPGTHTVSATCGGWTVTGGRFRVVAREAGRRAEEGTATAGNARTADSAGTADKAHKDRKAHKADEAAEARKKRPAAAGTVDEDTARASGGTVVPPHGVATAAPPPVHSAPAIPRRPVRAGFGGGGSHVPPVTVALGIGLVAGSLAAGGYYLIRRRPADFG
ncbi:hypothetical protein [Streptomyces sp. 8N616]|uniref:hypothetical protein n=1 Tax=Streptomyces sp. 8N616 TaxID=3457414 RepID=UPI003FCF2C8C